MPTRSRFCLSLILASMSWASLVVLGVPRSNASPILQTPAKTHTIDHDGEFQFWLGDWRVQNKHLQPSGDWRDGGIAKASIRSCLGGRAVIEQWNGQGELGLRGFSFRNYDPEQSRWEIVLNWHSGSPSGFSMMVGNFADGRGEFFPPNGPQRIRYTFSKTMPESCQWDQAKSSDGKQWKTDWIMSFTRQGPAKSLDASNLPIALPPKSVMNTFPKTRQLDSLIGAWAGEARRTMPDGTVEQGTAIRRVTSMIDGFGLLQLTKYSWGEESAAALSFNQHQGRWYEVGMSASDPDCHWLSGTKTDGSLRLDETALSNNGRNHIWENITVDEFQWTQESRQPASDEKPVVEIEVQFKRSDPEGRTDNASAEK